MKRITGYLRWLVPTALIVGLVPLGGAIASAVGAPAQGGSATLNGSGSTFQQPYDEQVIGAFKQKDSNVTINYSGGGSGKGRQDFSDQVVDFAGTDAPYGAADAASACSPGLACWAGKRGATRQDEANDTCSNSQHCAQRSQEKAHG